MEYKYYYIELSMSSAKENYEFDGSTLSNKHDCDKKLSAVFDINN